MNQTHELPLSAPPTPWLNRSWVPCCFLVMHDERVETTMRFTAMQVCRDTEARYQAIFRVYGEDPIQPIWSVQSDPIPLIASYNVSSRQIAAETRRNRLFAYAEEEHCIVGRDPDSAIIALGTHVHYASIDASVQGHIASLFIFGSPRSMLKGEYYCENFPGVRIGDGYDLVTYILNPFTKPSRCWVKIVDRHGKIFSSEELVAPGKGALEWNSSALGKARLANPCGVIVQSELKLNTIYATLGPERTMISLDHGHPFLSQVLKHG